MKKQGLDAEIPPGDDVCPTPPPLEEQPPSNRFCDLVLTGGVASGVVYPWAIVELARSYRFRNIGGTSVGAMAAALAAAAEYGRRNNFEGSFEPLRLTPAALAEVLPDGRTRLLSLFQANARGKRLVTLWGRLARGERRTETEEKSCQGKPGKWKLGKWKFGKWKFGWGKLEGGEHAFWLTAFIFMFQLIRVYPLPCAAGALVGAAPALLSRLFDGAIPVAVILATLPMIFLGPILGLVWAVWWDIRHGLIENGLGLCKGGSLEAPGPEGKRPGISEWLHDGLQLSAGLEKTDRPLTFRDLWNAPTYGGAAPRPCGDTDHASRRAINLQMITTNVTHGRPYRLPLVDETSRLFFDPEELKDYFQPAVIEALKNASCPYVPRSTADPPPDMKSARFLELPGADLPVVVATRLSLSFPLLFSAVPLWAIDYEAPPDQRTFKRCQFTDGGASSNFPVHLFDAALPRWPTFGLWLDRRTPYNDKQDVWLPEYHRQGWGDSWNRFDPEAAGPGEPPPAPHRCRSHAKLLFGFLGAIATSAVDWRDRSSLRLPHVRNRVARLLLGPRDGGLNIGMSRQQILQMAHRYGTTAGRLFVERFAEKQGQAARAWSEQRWVRLTLLINGLSERLTGLATSVDWATHTMPMPEAIRQALSEGPIKARVDFSRLSEEEVESLEKLLSELEHLEVLLRAGKPQPFKPAPEPELRLRAPL